MHQYNVGAPFERIAIDVAGPSHEASTIADTLVTNFCRFGIPRELHSDQGRNFESHLSQEVLQRLGVSK
jgi:hypothetical protein